ncbi:MAG TPA: hypothetical protein VHC63_08980 [Acidimicrobiales bacterium]|nr:hypothetical protein [Acidimicrobiales bacterium]
MFRRLALFVAVLGATVFALAGTAAADYATLTVNAAGVTVTCDADGFAANSPVTCTVHSEPFVLGTFTANAQGHVHGSGTLPANFASGVHTVTASGTDPAGHAREVTVGTITVPASATQGTVTTPARTGLAHTIQLTAVGAGLVALGGAMVLVVRRRTAPAAA